MSEVAICPVDDCKLTVDIVLKSSDGKLFGAHQRNLEMFTEGFPIAGSAVVSDPVSLEETAKVLHLMLRYTHNARLHSLDGISFTLLAPLAEAVEKYMIYSAMELCKISMTLAVDDHPNEVFLYSAKHNYPDLADKAAKLTLRNSVWDFLSLIRKAGLHDDISFRWFRYRERWMGVFVQLVLIDLAAGLHKYGSKQCATWPPFQNDVVKNVTEDPSVLDRFDDIVSKHFKSYDCSTCCLHSKLLASQVRESVRNLPNYSEA